MFLIPVCPRKADWRALEDCDQDESDRVCDVECESTINELSKRLLLKDPQVGAENGNFDDRQCCKVQYLICIVELRQC